MRILGNAGQLQGEPLAALLVGELARDQLDFALDNSPDEPRAWVDSECGDPRTLLIALLDTRREDYWQLYIVDAARRRAVARPLPGGLEQNAATLEAVSSIILSAAVALRDGQEVADQPVDQVVKPEPAQASVPPRPRPRPRPTLPPRPPPPPAVVARGSLSAAVASFTKDSPLTWGAAAALEATLLGALSVSLTLSRYLPARIASPYGNFSLTRTLVSLGAGPSFRQGALQFDPQAGAALEFVSRSSAEPTSTLSPRQDRVLARVGAILGFRVHLELAHPVGLVGVLGAAYYPRPMRFVARVPERRELAAPWPVVGTGQVGVEVSIP